MSRLLIAMVTLGFISSASAAEVDFGQVLNGVDGKPLVQSKDIPMATLADFVTTALMTDIRSETPAPSGQEKVKRWALAMKIERQQKVDLDADDTRRIKDTVALSFSPLIVGQVWSIVDPASVK